MIIEILTQQKKIEISMHCQQSLTTKQWHNMHGSFNEDLVFHSPPVNAIRCSNKCLVRFWLCIFSMRMRWSNGQLITSFRQTITFSSSVVGKNICQNWLSSFHYIKRKMIISLDESTQCFRKCLWVKMQSFASKLDFDDGFPSKCILKPSCEL